MGFSSTGGEDRAGWQHRDVDPVTLLAAAHWQSASFTCRSMGFSSTRGEIGPESAPSGGDEPVETVEPPEHEPVSDEDIPF